MIQTFQNKEHTRIYLWGFMGSGKSTIGRELAQRLDFEFLDLDERMEALEKRTVAEIFALKGEEYFRELEHDTLKQIAKTQNRIVISTGGGTPCYFDNAEIMNKSGVTVYLKVSPKALKKRLIDDEIYARPLLTSLNWLDIMALYQSRQELYESAQIKVSNEQDITYCLQRILERIEKIDSAG